MVNLPELMELVPSAGHELLTIETHPAAVARAAKAAEADGTPFVVVAAAPDDRARSWLSLQAANGRRVLVLESDELGRTPANTHENVRSLSLPTVLDRVLVEFGAPPSGTDGGATLIHEDGTSGAVVDDIDAYLPADQATPVQRDSEVEDLFARDLHGDEAAVRGYAPCIAVAGFRGGVGKSSLAIQMAERAATHGGVKRVVLIDVNRGQGDIRTMLGLGPDAPSVYTAAMRDEPKQGLMSPNQVNASRSDNLPPVHFGVALAPLRDQGDPKVVTHGTYSQIIKTARQVADLVILDTQIKEGHDSSGLFDHLVVPMLLAGAWTVCVTDSSRAGVRNIVDGIRDELTAEGVSRDRIHVVMNRKRPSFADDKVQALKEILHPWAGFIGAIDNDDEQIGDMVEAGRTPHSHPQIAPVLDDVLHRVTGRAEFLPRPEPQPRRKSRRRKKAA